MGRVFGTPKRISVWMSMVTNVNVNILTGTNRTPPSLFCGFCLVELEPIKKHPTQNQLGLGGLHFFAGAFWLCRLHFFHFNGSSINRRIHEPQSAHPNKSHLPKVLKDPFAKLDANDQLYISCMYKSTNIKMLSVSECLRLPGFQPRSCINVFYRL